jgi:hypothetical protein
MLMRTRFVPYLFSSFISSTSRGVSKRSFFLQVVSYISDDLTSVRARALFELALEQPH